MSSWKNIGLASVSLNSKTYSTYTMGLVTCEGKKNIQAINRTFMETKHQSSLNRFLTQSP
ncbi:MAG: hypothetical protein ABSF44_08895 [Candidatus Bathyarchaeia archaeon]|jgi:hypothetical protein